MKLKLIYGFMYGLIGIMAGTIIFFLAAFIIFFLLNIFLPQENIISYINVILLVFMATVGFFLVFMILKGIKKGERLEKNEDITAVNASTKKFFLTTALVFFIFIYFFTDLFIRFKDNFYKKNKVYIEFGKDIKTIDSIAIEQSGDGVIAGVKIKGITQDKYKLVLRLYSYGHSQEKLLEYSDNIILEKDENQYMFFIPFSEIGETYRQALIKMIPNFKENHNLEDFIIFEFSLILKESEKYQDKDISKMEDFSNISSGAARFVFDCDREYCNIKQEENPEE